MKSLLLRRENTLNKMKMNRESQIFDTTLRDGEQVLDAN
jgi:hypothetical protein